MNIVDRARQALAAGGSIQGQAFEWDGKLRGRQLVIDIYEGSGAPTASFPSPNPKQGSLYFRRDGHAAGANIYKYDGAWFGIA